MHVFLRSRANQESMPVDMKQNTELQKTNAKAFLIKDRTKRDPALHYKSAKARQKVPYNAFNTHIPPRRPCNQVQRSYVSNQLAQIRTDTKCAFAVAYTCHLQLA
jgi:hypothetical protein